MSQTAKLSKGIILIVDDAPGNLAVLSDMLSEADYRVLVATDGVSALQQIEYLRPDIVLLDVMMPGIDGFETCKRLKKNPETSRLPVIFMTGLSELDDLLCGFGNGAVDYIVKPIRPEEVLVRIEAQLSQSRNLHRAEESLTHIAFAALSFDGSGLMTWLSPTALEILNDPESKNRSTTRSLGIGDVLPEYIFRQVFTVNGGSSYDQSICLGNDYYGKIFPRELQNESILLIRQNTREWDIDSITSTFGLTKREAEILKWISLGKTNKEVGLILNSSPRTINKHLEHVFEKLGVPTRTAAVVKVLTNTL